MKMIKVLMVLLPVLFAATAAAKTTDHVVGAKHVIESKSIEQSVGINVYLPESYHTSKQSYPVLYVLDGHRFDLMAAGYQKSLHFYARAPEFIVVGITNQGGPERRKLLSDKASNYMDLLEHEVLPLVDKTYRTKKNRMIFGWQMAGALTFELLAKRPQLFDAYFSASFTYYSDETNPALMIGKRIEQGLTEQEFLYVVMTPTERWVMEETDELVALLEAKAPKNLRWQQHRPEDEDHWSSHYQALYKGIKHYYFDFEPVKFDNLKAFEAMGGLAGVKKQAEKRGKRYGISGDIASKTQFSLVLNAMRENNYEAFHGFMTEFKGYLESTRFPNWGNRLGQFYLTHDQHEKALHVFNTVLIKFKDTPLLHNGLGDVYKAKGDKKAAAKHYKNAVELARKQGDSRLDDFEEDLQGL